MLKNKLLYTLVILSVVVSMGGAQFQPAQAQRPAQIDPAAPDAPDAGPSFIQQLPDSAVSRIAEGGGRLYWFAGSTLYSLDKNCPIAPDCTPQVLVNENGASLLYHARISGAGRSHTFLYGEDGRSYDGRNQRASRGRQIRSLAQRDPDRAIDRHRQHKTVVVIGVFADEVDAARRAHDRCRRFAEASVKFNSDAILKGHYTASAATSSTYL
jgi:hypothetical protein